MPNSEKTALQEELKKVSDVCDATARSLASETELLSAANARIEKAVNKNKALRVEMQSQSAELDGLKEQVQQLNEQLTGANSKVEEVQAASMASEQALTELKEHSKTRLEKAIVKMKEQKAELDAKSTELTEAQAQVEKLTASTSELEDLRAVVSERDGLQIQVKELSETCSSQEAKVQSLNASLESQAGLLSTFERGPSRRQGWQALSPWIAGEVEGGLS